MNPPFGPDAARSLEQVRRHQSQVVDSVLVPKWYWWAVASLTVGLCAVADAHDPVLTGVAAVAYAMAVTALSVAFVLGLRRHVRINSEMLGPAGAVSIVVFVGALVGGTLAVAFSLQAAGDRYPATISSVVTALGLVAGGPLLMKRLRRVMLARGSGAGDD